MTEVFSMIFHVFVEGTPHTDFRGKKGVAQSYKMSGQRSIMTPDWSSSL